jgi:hypothetical protein
VTQAQPRGASETSGPVSILDLDPREQVAALNVDSLSSVTIGTVLRDRLDAPVVVRGLEFRITADKLRAFAWWRAAA